MIASFDTNKVVIAVKIPLKKIINHQKDNLFCNLAALIPRIFDLEIFTNTDAIDQTRTCDKIFFMKVERGYYSSHVCTVRHELLCLVSLI